MAPPMSIDNGEITNLYKFYYIRLWVVKQD